MAQQASSACELTNNRLLQLEIVGNSLRRPCVRLSLVIGDKLDGLSQSCSAARNFRRFLVAVLEIIDEFAIERQRSRRRATGSRRFIAGLWLKLLV